MTRAWAQLLPGGSQGIARAGGGPLHSPLSRNSPNERNLRAPFYSLQVATAGDSGNATYRVTVEGDGLKIDKELDRETALQVVELVMGGVPEAPARRSRKPAVRRKAAGRAKSGEPTRSPRRRRSSSPGIVKDLSLRPSGKQAFVEFAKEKAPSNHYEKQAVIVYWLQHVAATNGTTVGHVNTCYQEAGWTRPTDLDANLSLTASRKGTLDTSDMDNITVTTRGEDLVRHSLPSTSTE
jgi:hypothetical protein